MDIFPKRIWFIWAVSLFLHLAAADSIQYIAICEFGAAKIKCLAGTRIVITEASYGRTDQSTCLPILVNTTNCRANNSLEIVNGRCRHMNECHLQADNSWFGDPCIGTHKYLQVQYKCVAEPAKDIQQLFICESGTNKIKCPVGERIVITEASYGRTDRTSCPQTLMENTNCSSSNSFEIVNQKCGNKNECHLQADNSWFGDPCIGTHKYLRVLYKCISEPAKDIQQLLICESGSNKIKCPVGTSVVITEASYGRMDRTSCPHALMENTNCSSSNSFQIVNQKCGNKNECHLQADNSWFGDPCIGTHKYLRVLYKCISVTSVASDSIKTMLVCEGSRELIQCPEGTSILIMNAIYGRGDRRTCPHRLMGNTNCRAENAFDVISNRCERNKECELYASNSWFGDPCSGTYKYLAVDYQCVKVPANVIQSELICEGSNKDIHCPLGTTIMVMNASYGRTDATVCPHPNIIDTKCKTKHAHDIVTNRCEYKENCYLEASNNWFNDPCAGTHKYLTVDYQCVKVPANIIQTLVICESGANKIKCPVGTSIVITEASYGRSDQRTCPYGDMRDTNCHTDNSFLHVNGRCGSKNECDLQANNGVFGDPCIGTYKYLQVQYKCVKG